MPARGKGKWFDDGYAQGEFAATVAVAEDEAELRKAMDDDELGRIAGEIRGHQTQMAGDISYDVGKPNGPTEAQYERWDQGFTAGFVEGVRGRLGTAPNNIYWRDIKPGSRVEFRRGAYVVDDEAAAFWHGQEAAEAQRALDAMVRKAPSGASPASGPDWPAAIAEQNRRRANGGK